MPTAPDDALRKLEKMLSRDPMLRDVIARTLPRPQKAGRFTPDIDVLELPDRFVILADLPGVIRESLSVSVDGSRLTLEGEKPLHHAAGGSVKVGERACGKFRREFQLPSRVDGNAVAARLRDGVLRIELPHHEASAKQVKVDVT
jgi:HSP20 family protein